jgi:hypothetical protein
VQEISRIDVHGYTVKFIGLVEHGLVTLFCVPMAVLDTVQSLGGRVDVEVSPAFAASVAMRPTTVALTTVILINKRRFILDGLKIGTLTSHTFARK